MTGHWTMISLLLVQLLLAFVSTVDAAPAVDQAEEPTIFVLRGGSNEFWCRYDASIDVAGARDLVVTVQDCSKQLEIPLQAADVSAIAAVVGSQTSNLKSYRTVFDLSSSDVPPVYRINQNHPLIKDGSVSGLYGNTSLIAVTIWDQPSTQSKCAFCGQAGRTMGYTTTDKRRIQVVSPPAAGLSLKNRQLPAASSGSDLEADIREGEAFLLNCSGSGGGGSQRLSTKLEKSSRTLASSTAASVSYSVPNATASDAGVYQCLATSDLPHLVSLGQHTGSSSLTLRVSFPPAIEVDEAVRFTRVGESEDIQVKVSAYPEPELTCRSNLDDEVSSSGPEQDSRLRVKQSYSRDSYFATYIVTFANANEIANETLITCSARNSLGSRQVDIRLTALAPTPQIVSGSGTHWWNSYDLRWQHHVKADVHFYRIRILYLGPDDAVVNKTEQRLESVKQTEDPASGLRQAKDLVFNLSPDTAHKISLQACNQHGCSPYSEHVQVRTVKESADTYNDPRNPVFAEPQSDGKGGDAARQIASVQWMSSLATLTLLMAHLY